MSYGEYFAEFGIQVDIRYKLQKSMSDMASATRPSLTDLSMPPIELQSTHIHAHIYSATQLPLLLFIFRPNGTSALFIHSKPA